MRRGIAKIKGLGFVLWHARHMGYHVLVGLGWVWMLSKRWDESLPSVWIITSVIGSLLPDVDHLFYLFGHGRGDDYSGHIRELLHERKWRAVIVFMENGHKHNFGLVTHNYIVMIVLMIVGAVASVIDWNVGVVLIGAMFLHYLFDILDDLVLLGRTNPNWKRWGRAKSN